MKKFNFSLSRIINQFRWSLPFLSIGNTSEDFSSIKWAKHSLFPSIIKISCILIFFIIMVQFSINLKVFNNLIFLFICQLSIVRQGDFLLYYFYKNNWPFFFIFILFFSNFYYGTLMFAGIWYIRFMKFMIIIRYIFLFIYFAN